MLSGEIQRRAFVLLPGLWTQDETIFENGFVKILLSKSGITFWKYEKYLLCSILSSQMIIINYICVTNNIKIFPTEMLTNNIKKLRAYRNFEIRW